MNRESSLAGFIGPSAAVPSDRPRAGLRTLGAVLAALIALRAVGAAQTTGLRPARLRILFANSLIQNANPNDALAAFKVWVESVGRNRGFSLDVDAAAYRGLDEVERRVQEGTVDLVVFTSLDYLRIEPGGPLEPKFCAVLKSDAMFDDYVLVTRRDRSLTTLAALRGKSLMVYQFGGELGRLWLDVTLGEGGFGSASEFFGACGEGSKPSAVVLPVFFGKSDAGVVIRSGLETMMEMNPQLARQLQALIHSPILAESVICVHRDHKDFRQELMDGLADLHHDLHGKQLLLVFKIDRLVPFKSGYLDSVRDLRDRWVRLKGHSSAGDADAAANRPALEKETR